jgi:hypothetical protein
MMNKKKTKLRLSILNCVVSLATLTAGAPVIYGSSIDVDPTEDVAEMIRRDRCAAKVVDAAASEAFELIVDSGADWPEGVSVVSLERDDSREPINYRVVVAGFAFSFELLNQQRCELSQVTRLKTVVMKDLWSSPEIKSLERLGQKYLGNEFFGDRNIGGATSFLIDDDSGFEWGAVAAVRQYYQEWRGLARPEMISAKIENVKSPANIETLLKEVLSIAGTDRRTTNVAHDFAQIASEALKANPSWTLVSGHWRDVGMGDPEAGFLAIVSSRSGKVLVLEQGFVD